MKAVNTIKKILMVIIGVLYFSFALLMTILLLNFNDYGVTQFGDTSLILLKDKISSQEFVKGDLVFVNAVEIEEVEKGETIFAYRVDSKGAVHVEVGTIGEVYPSESAIAFENGETYSSEFIVGRPSNVYHNLGSILSVIESQWGFLFIVLVPCFLLFIYQIYALIVEIKYGADDYYDY